MCRRLRPLTAIKASIQTRKAGRNFVQPFLQFQAIFYILRVHFAFNLFDFFFGFADIFESALPRLPSTFNQIFRRRITPFGFFFQRFENDVVQIAAQQMRSAEGGMLNRFFVLIFGLIRRRLCFVFQFRLPRSAIFILVCQ
jgi:hypothetical protein